MKDRKSLICKASRGWTEHMLGTKAHCFTISWILKQTKKGKCCFKKQIQALMRVI